MLKPYTKKLIGYAIAAFILGFPIQIFAEWASRREICDTPLWGYILGATIFSILSTLFKYFSDWLRNKTN